MDRGQIGPASKSDRHNSTKEEEGERRGGRILLDAHPEKKKKMQADGGRKNWEALEIFSTVSNATIAAPLWELPMGFTKDSGVKEAGHRA